LARTQQLTLAQRKTDLEDLGEDVKANDEYAVKSIKNILHLIK
jgi:hypothetical protein